MKRRAMVYNCNNCDNCNSSRDDEPPEETPVQGSAPAPLGGDARAAAYGQERKAVCWGAFERAWRPLLRGSVAGVSLWLLAGCGTCGTCGGSRSGPGACGMAQAGGGSVHGCCGTAGAGAEACTTCRSAAGGVGGAMQPEVGYKK